MRVLLIEDQPSSASPVAQMLSAEGFAIYWTGLAEMSVEPSNLAGYDIVLLDLNSPHLRDYHTLRRLRVIKAQTPVLILSGILQMDAKVRLLGFGADAHLAKPVRREELVARVQIMARGRKDRSRSVICAGQLKVDLDSRTVKVGATHVHLSNSEYAVLELLLMRKGTIVTKRMLADHLYRGRGEPDLKTIDVFVCHLRKKLVGAMYGESLIETVRGRGYVLLDPDHGAIAS